MNAKVKALLIKTALILLPGMLFASNAMSAVPDYGEAGEYESRETLLDLANGLGLPLVVRYPVDREGPAPTIIFLHGFGAGGAFIPFGDALYRDLTEHYVSRGYNVIAPVVTADLNIVLTAGVGYPIYANEVLWAGVQAGVTYLAAQGRIDTSKFGVMGHSLGGGVTPFITKKVAQRGWGDDGLFMAQLAPWYTHLVKDRDLANLPEHTKLLSFVFADDTVNSQRMAIDIHHHLGVNELEKDFLLYVDCRGNDSGGHNLPVTGSIAIPPSSNSDEDDDFLWRHIDALAHYSFEGPNASAGGENAREVSLGVTPAGLINRGPQMTGANAESDCIALGTDDPTNIVDQYGDDYDVDLKESQFGLSKWDGTLNFIGPIVTPFPAGPFLNVRWYIWDDYFEDGIKRGSVLHYFAYLLKDILPPIADLLQGIGDALFSFSSIGSGPINLFQSNIGVDLPKVTLVPKVCLPKTCWYEWKSTGWFSGYWKKKCTQVCTPEISAGPVSFHPVSIKASLDDMSIGQLSSGELMSPVPADDFLTNPQPYVQSLDFAMQDIEVGVKIESNVLGINGVVEDILDFLGLGQTLDALDGNFTSQIKLDRLAMPIDFSISNDGSGYHTTILPGLASSDFETKIDVPDAFNIFGFDLAQKVVDRITSGIDDARNFILGMVFENMLSNLFMPALGELNVSDAVSMGPLEILPTLQQSCVRYETSRRLVRNGWWYTWENYEQCVEWGWP